MPDRKSIDELFVDLKNQFQIGDEEEDEVIRDTVKEEGERFFFEWITAEKPRPSSTSELMARIIWPLCEEFGWKPERDVLTNKFNITDGQATYLIRALKTEEPNRYSNLKGNMFKDLKKKFEKLVKKFGEEVEDHYILLESELWDLLREIFDKHEGEYESVEGAIKPKTVSHSGHKKKFKVEAKTHAKNLLDWIEEEIENQGE